MRKISAVLGRLEESLLVLIFTILVLACFAQVLFRFLFNYPLDWTEELARFAFIPLVYLATVVAVRTNRHISVEVMDNLLPPPALKYLHTFAELVCLGLFATLAFYGLMDAREKYLFDERSPAMQWPLWIPVAGIPLCLILASARICERIFARHATQQEHSQ